jgi:hypothetical protein
MTEKRPPTEAAFTCETLFLAGALQGWRLPARRDLAFDRGRQVADFPDVGLADRLVADRVQDNLAAQLLKEGNPANRAALARKAKAFF